MNVQADVPHHEEVKQDTSPQTQATVPMQLVP